MGGTTVRWRRSAAVTALALAALAGCSTGGGTGAGAGGTSAGPASPGRTAARGSVPRPVTALQAVDRSTGRARSARVEGTAVLGPGISTRMTGTMAWDGSVTGSLDITYTGGALADTLRQAGAGSTVRARYRRDAYYADMGPGFAARTGGRRWIRYGYADLTRLMGPSGAALRDQMRKAAPDQGVKALLASGDVHRAGQTDIRGVPATHYSGTLDVAALTERDSALTPAALKAVRAQLTAAGISTETVDIWVDRNDLLVKKTERGRLKTGTYSSTVYYSDYGTAVRADAPPAGDTTDFTDLLKTPVSTPAPGA
ncbi:hypothetical protein [Streptomyces sp. NPDC059398]|uniref:hypothetical protein n=1 Tax=Streptomyces sp. NPDC059398 TaxID=3346820 RepID=UPI0036B1AB1C